MAKSPRHAEPILNGPWWARARVTCPDCQEEQIITVRTGRAGRWMHAKADSNQKCDLCGWIFDLEFKWDDNKGSDLEIE